MLGSQTTTKVHRVGLRHVVWLIVVFKVLAQVVGVTPMLECFCSLYESVLQRS